MSRDASVCIVNEKGRVQLNIRLDPCCQCNKAPPATHEIHFANADMWVCDSCFGGGARLCCTTGRCYAFDNCNGKEIELADSDTISRANHCEGWLDEDCRTRCDAIECGHGASSDFDHAEDGRLLCPFCTKRFLKYELAKARRQLDLCKHGAKT